MRAPQRAARRREEILDSAMRLFARDGIAAVSTGQVAEAAGVSPGNLYYWFGSKAEIVRELFGRWADESALDVPADAEPAQVLALLWAGLSGQAALVDRWSFFARDLLPLLHADPELAERYRRNHEARVELFCGLVGKLVTAGLLRAPAAGAAPVRDLVEAVWLLVETSGAFARLVPGIDPASAVQAVVAPLITPAGWEILTQADADV